MIAVVVMQACRIVPFARDKAILHSISAQHKNYIATLEKRQATYFLMCLNKRVGDV